MKTDKMDEDKKGLHGPDKEKIISQYHQLALTQSETIKKQKQMIEFLKKKLEERLEPSLEIALSKEQITYDDIGGLDRIVAEIRHFQYGIAYPKMYGVYGIDPPQGLLLYGPPGCGKTMIAKAMSNELDCWFMEIPLTRIISEYVGKAERNLEQALDLAKSKYAESSKKVLIFVDEAEQMFKRRGSYLSHGVLDRCVSVWLRTMDGMGSSQGLIFVAATNHLEEIDPALLRAGRFDYIMPVPPPDLKAITEILLKQMVYKEKLAKRKIYQVGQVQELAELMHQKQMTGADIAEVLKKASLRRIGEFIETEKDITKAETFICAEDLQRIVIQYPSKVKKAEKIGFGRESP